MIFDAFKMLAIFMSRRMIKDGDIEIVVRCKSRHVQNEFCIQLLEERIGRDHIVKEGDNSRLLDHGTIWGIPFRVEAKH
jgi:hypothetical protein